MTHPAPRARRVAGFAAVLALILGALALGGCDLPGGDDDDTVATSTTTTETGTTGPNGPSGQNGNGGGGGGGGGGVDQTPEDTGPVVPESGGVGVDEYESEQDSEQNDTPPPPGSPAEQFEQECAQHPEIC